MSPEVLSAIRGFKSLGTFFLANDLDLSKMLSDYLAATATPPNPEPAPELLTDLIGQLAMPSRGDFVRFFSFPVFSNSPTQVFLDGLLPVWKWVKQDSIYRRGGFWEAKLDKAIEDGEWTGGKQLDLLVRGVMEQTLQNITAGGCKHTSFNRIPEN
ncbi:uncharacterized protein P884DRAFT_263972 [Thermothelomyces heterothallicus CBS 202.75]|uniref:uncharacterized protein n=1 Tax=Thermothelomyces heterothallicus CBS 202.75 TaxID=1149848 RepID=UPI003744A468